MSTMIPGAGTPISDIPEPQSFEAIPAGKRLAIVIAGEMCDTANKKAGIGIGEFLKLEFQLVEGPNAGAHVWERYNLINDNQTAVEIAYRDLGALCRMLGLAVIPTQVQELMNKPVVVDVGIEQPKIAGTKQPDPNAKPQNKINGYTPAATWAHVQAAPQAPAYTAPAPVYPPPVAAAAAYAPPAAASGGSAPWLRK